MISKETFDIMCDAQNLLKNQRNEILEYIKSLETTEAIEAIKKVPEHLCKHKSWILQPESYEKVYGEVSWYDDFYADRYQTVYLSNCVDQMQDHDEPDEKIQLFVKSWLENDCLAFCNDW